MNFRLFPMQRSQIAKKTVLVVLLAIFLFSFFTVLPVTAQEPLDLGVEQAEDIGLGGRSLMEVIVRVVRAILGFLGIIAVIIIMYGGFVWMTAGGDPTKVDTAKRILRNAVIGLIIILSAFTIASFVLNIFERGTPGSGTRNPGGGGDTGRWGIGLGPIESVYPAPGQNDVPINTGIIVTFKESVNPSTICDVGAGESCDGHQMRNVEICMLDDDNLCSEDEFEIEFYENSTVQQTENNRTFVFTPENYLGSVDGIERRFQVTLQEGIESIAEPGKSIFDSLPTNEYLWAFYTNGELDLDPPEVYDVTGIYPYPDNLEDNYGVSASPVPTTYDIPVIGITNADIKGKVNASYDQPTPIPGTTNATITGSYAGSMTGEVEITIASGDADSNIIVAVWPDGQTHSNQIEGNVLNIGPYGLTFTADNVPVVGNQWTFDVVAAHSGDRIEILEDNTVRETYVFGEDINIESTAASTQARIIAAVNSNSAIFERCTSVCDLQTQITGAPSNRYMIRFVDGDSDSSNDAVTVQKLQSGADQIEYRTINGQPDAYRNVIFQINFNEAINPIFVDNLIVTQDGSAVSGFRIDISNQYKTVELTAPGSPCGINSCGENMYCWPVSGDVSEYEVTVRASSLLTASDSRCEQWGGSSTADGSNRCVKTMDGEQVFLPQSAASVDGFIDMSFNSFNGSLNTYREGGEIVGISEGQSGSGDGNSGRPAYNITDNRLTATGALVDGTFGDSTPVHGVSGWGDNLVWSFFVSSIIDNEAPLVSTVSPLGDEEIEDKDQKVILTFDRLMRSSTLKPGWNYGDTAREKTTRYVVLDTITPNANPVGFWITKDDLDNNSDFWADITRGVINHNDFDSFIKYGPLGGSGIESITQNCFLPSSGPKDAGAVSCNYTGGVLGANCVAVDKENPASYGFLDCNEIKNTDVCASDEVCRPLFDTEEDIYGSWVLTKDYPSEVDGSGRTGCCLGRCIRE